MQANGFIFKIKIKHIYFSNVTFSGNSPTVLLSHIWQIYTFSMERPGLVAP